MDSTTINVDVINVREKAMEIALKEEFFDEFKKIFTDDKYASMPRCIWLYCNSTKADMDTYIHTEVDQYINWLAIHTSERALNSEVWMRYARYIGDVMEATGWEYLKVEALMNRVVTDIINVCTTVYNKNRYNVNREI